MKTLMRIAGWLATAAGPGAAWAQERGWPGRWESHPMWWMWSAWGLGMMVAMLAFWALAILGLVVGVRWLLRGPGAARSDTAVDILRERYARGEIGKDEFDARRRDLGSR